MYPVYDFMMILIIIISHRFKTAKIKLSYKL